MADNSWNELKYIDGFGSHVCTEALPEALPVGQNSPQVCPYGLYAEQLSGSPFTAPRAKNLRSWLYRIRPSVCHAPYKPSDKQSIHEAVESLVVTPNQLRWDPVELPSPDAAQIDFVDGLQLVCSAGDPSMKEGMSIYNYAVNASMKNRAFYNSDGDFLIVPQIGTLYIKTEMGKMKVEPCEICVIQRGIKFTVEVTESSRGYIAELFKGHLELPGLGPIGANGLANPRDFQSPVAFFEDIDGLDTSNGGYTIVNKYMNKFFHTPTDHSPFDVVAWHGNYGPYKYDLRKFNCINSVTYDHPDPSIYTVLTCPTDEPGTAVIDFVIFPPRWMVAEHTFRPPWYHRNCMSEYMGMIYGKYDAKSSDTSVDSRGRTKKGFVAGGASLHSCMTPHGPDAITFSKASAAPLVPTFFGEGLAFMFETSYLLKVTSAALNDERLQESYNECWDKMPKLFTGEKKPKYPWESS